MNPLRHRLPALALFLACCFFASAQVSVTTQHNDLLRTGWNNNETVLNPSTVNVRQFGKVFRLAVDDQMYAQPLILSKLKIGGGTHNVVYASTVNNTIYAADADSGKVYWSKNYTPAGQRPTQRADMTGACGGNYKDFTNNIGIVGTPVIDSTTNTLYFVARSTSGTAAGAGPFFQYLHAIDAVTGADKPGSPVAITASVNGTGDGSVNGIIRFDPQKNNQRQALTLVNGILYITFSSHCDWGPYHGWILGYNASTLQQTIVYNPTPNGYNAGIWQSGGGPSADAAGNIYVVTGNGSVGANNNPSNTINRGESALKLTPSGNTLAVAGFFTPKNYQALENADLDYGSLAAFLIPNTKLYFTGGKDGNLYLLNTDNLGGYSSSTNNVVQTISLGTNATLRCQPAYYRSATKEFVYVWSENSQLKALPLNRSNNSFDVNKLVTGSTPGPNGGNGAVLAASSNNSQDGTGILWASYAATGDANQASSPGILRAFDANDITRELWNSNQNASRDGVGNYAKFGSPAIANGKVYLPTFSNQLVVYGIVDSAQAPACTSTTNLALNKTAVASSLENNTYPASYAFDNNGGTRWSSAQGTDPQWVYVDLGAVDSICNITLEWETAAGKDFQLQVSNNAQTWSTVSSISANSALVNSIDVKAAGRYVRMYGTARATPYGYSLYEMQVFGSLIQGCTTPGGVTVNNIDSNSAVIRWTKTNAASYNVQYRLSSGTNLQVFNTTADSLRLTGLSCSEYYTYNVQAVCAGGGTSSYSADASFNTLPCGNCGFLPTRFYTVDVGNVGVSGQACFTSPGLYTVNGSGDDIWNNADAFRFAYKTFAGDGRIDVKITSQDQTNVWNKAGLMFRESLDAGSRHAFMSLTSGNGAAFQYRDVTNGASTNVNTGTFKAPYYVRIVKKGTTFTGFISADSLNWNQVGTATISGMGANGASLYAGLAVCSHDNTLLSRATFNGLNYIFDSTAATPDSSCGTLPSNVTASNVGATGVNGSVCYVTSSGRYKVKGSGSDINGTADAFYFVSKVVNGADDVQLNTKLVSQDQTASGNRAGLMYRKTLTAGSASIMIGLVKDSGAVFQYRSATNGATTRTILKGYQAPYFLRLTKVGGLFTAYISADSITWKKLASVTLNGFKTGTSYAGLAVTSHNNSIATEAAFDGWKIVNSSGATLARPVIAASLPAGAGAENGLALKAYPNPGSAAFAIDFNIEERQNIALAITGAGDGRIYYTESKINFQGNYHQVFSHLKLSAGVYYITLKTTHGIQTLTLIRE